MRGLQGNKASDWFGKITFQSFSFLFIMVLMLLVVRGLKLFLEWYYCVMSHDL